MRSRHTLPTIVTNPWTQDLFSHGASTRRTTDNLDSWAVNAAFWDKTVGEGNDMYQELVLPAVERLAELKPGTGECVLDLATGNGITARRLKAGAGGGSRIMATDGCAELLDFARARERANVQPEGEGTGERESAIEYEQLDLMDTAQLDAFTQRHSGAFDVVTLVMTILELPSLEPLARALPRLLKPKTGRFIAVNMHSAFCKPGAHRVVEVLENPNTGQQETRHSIKSVGYMSIPPCTSQGIRDQPAPQTLFHRPLQDVLGPFLESGEMALDRFKELAFDHEPDRAQIQSFHNFPQFPILVAFRMRRIG